MTDAEMHLSVTAIACSELLIAVAYCQLSVDLRVQWTFDCSCILSTVRAAILAQAFPGRASGRDSTTCCLLHAITLDLAT